MEEYRNTFGLWWELRREKHCRGTRKLSLGVSQRSGLATFWVSVCA